MQRNHQALVMALGVFLSILGVVIFLTEDAIGLVAGSVVVLAGVSTFIWGRCPSSSGTRQKGAATAGTGVSLQILGVIVFAIGYETWDPFENFGWAVIFAFAGILVFTWGCIPASAVTRRRSGVLVTVCISVLIGAALLSAFRVGPFDDTITVVDAHAEDGVAFAEFSIDFDQLPRVENGWQRRVFVRLEDRRERMTNWFYEMGPFDAPGSGKKIYSVALPLMGLGSRAPLQSWRNEWPSRVRVEPGADLVVEVADTAKNRAGAPIYDRKKRRALNVEIPEFHRFEHVTARTHIDSEVGGTFDAGPWATVAIPPKALVRNGEVFAHARSAKYVKMLTLNQAGHPMGEFELHPGESITVTFSYSDLGEWNDLQLLVKARRRRLEPVDRVQIDEVAKTVTFEPAAGEDEYYLVRR